MFRYFIYLSFDGTNYHGWQIQPNGASVQETLMKALSTFLRREIEVVGAGRTDAGVHARLMVAHFDFDTELDGEVVTDKLNRLLPPDIAVYGVRRVKPRRTRALMQLRARTNIISIRGRIRSAGVFVAHLPAAGFRTDERGGTDAV